MGGSTAPAPGGQCFAVGLSALAMPYPLCKSGKTFTNEIASKKDIYFEGGRSWNSNVIMGIKSELL
jgi:hypothetical protein